MAVTNQQIIDFLVSNPGMTDAQIVAAMEQYGVSPAQMASAVGLPEGEVTARVAATVPQGQSITLGDTIVQPQYSVTGSGENQQVGGLENVLSYKVSENKEGGDVKQFSPTGEYQQTTQQQKVDTSLGGVVKDIASNPLVQAGLLAYGVGTGLEGLLGGAGAAGTVGATGLTTAELAQLDLALGGAGGTAGATSLANALATGATIPTLTNLTGGSGVSSLLAGGAGTTGLLTSAGTPVTTSAVTGALTPTATGALTTAATGALTPTITSTLAPIVKAAIPAVTGALTGTMTPTNLSNLISGGLGTAGNLLQMQQSKEAALAAQQRIDAETAAAKQAAQFRPVGMTTRFGTSQFQVDPVTGQITSAGYTLSPEAKAAQDRLVALAGQGLTQAEAAQQQFAPLQTGAQNLFNLGNQYLAQSPQEVAQNYLNQQMALLQPGRELELANLQNKLQQQGRAGLSVAQGGTYGATTPELQALYNARAMQEAQLAAQAQQVGQQQVQFGAGLLGTGAQTLGNYYAGQQAAYAPYTTALGQVQALETAAQQPLTMGASLGQTAAQAGANAGRLGLTGAGQSVALATGANATANPYAQLLSAAGNPNAMFGSTLNTMLGGLFGGSTPVNALDYSAYGTGNTGLQNMLNDIYG